MNAQTWSGRGTTTLPPLLLLMLRWFMNTFLGVKPALAIPSRGSQFHRNYYLFFFITFKQRGTHETSAWLHVRKFTSLRAWLHKSTRSLDAPLPIHCLCPSTHTHTRIQNVNEKYFIFRLLSLLSFIFHRKIADGLSHKNQVIRRCSMKRDRVIFMFSSGQFHQDYANDFVLSYRHLRWWFFRAENT